MIRILRAFVWLRTRLFINAFRKARGRDELERISRGVQALIPILLLVLMVPGMILLAVGAFFGGRHLANPDVIHRQVLILLRGILAIVTIALFIAPLARTLHRAGSGLERLVLLPIPRALLHLMEVASNLFDPWMLAIIPAVMTLPVGMFFGGAPTMALLTFIAGAALILCLGAMGTFIISLLNLALRNRRRGELVALIVLALFTLGGLAPMALGPAHEKPEKSSHINPAVFRWAKVLPSEIYARGLIAETQGRLGEGAWFTLGLAAVGGGFYGLSWLTFRRLLETPAGGGGRRGGNRQPLRLWRLPGLSPAASAVAAAEVRLTLRTVRGKTAVYFTPASVALLGIVSGYMARQSAMEEPLLFRGPGLAVFGTLMALLSFQPFQMNQFAGDRAGLTLQFLVPLSERDLVRGKAAGIALLWSITEVLCLAAAGLAAPGGSLDLLLAIGLAGAGALIGLTPTAAALSALFPKPADPGRLGKEGNPHGAASLLGGLSTFVLLAIPLVPAFLISVFLKSPLLALAITAGWTVVVILISILFLGPVAALVARRRENLGLVAQGR